MNRRANVIASAVAVALITWTASSAWSLSAGNPKQPALGAMHTFDGARSWAAAARLADDDVPAGADDADVPPKMVEKYTNAYKAMQKDHNLTADQAAAAQGLTIAQFRSVEGRIERDDTLRERVRKALRNSTPGGKDKESSNQ
jgi:hypothetical protein